jgi:hypothetical protein
VGKAEKLVAKILGGKSDKNSERKGEALPSKTGARTAFKV